MDKQNIKIFLVEDDIMIRDMYEDAFRLMGYHIETAIDGQDGVDKLDKMAQLPTLMLLDMLMPKMSGFDVLNYLRNNEKFKDIIVVMLTSVGEKEAAEKAIELGAVAYLVKSDYVPKDIVAKVKEIITDKMNKN